MYRPSYHIPQLLCLALLLTSACIDPIIVDNIPNEGGNIVVDGLITDKEGPYSIRIYNSSAYFLTDENFEVIQDANVFIIDQTGALTNLQENAPGNYQTPPNFKGEIGSTYVLTIELANGKTYRSQPETLYPNAGIDSLKLEYQVKSELNDLNIPVETDGIAIKLTTNTLEGNKFYRWRYGSVYEVRTTPKDRVRGTTPDPPECSGYIYDFFNFQFVQVGPCTCCTCWVSEFSNKVTTSKPNFIGDQITGLDLGFIRDIDGKFAYKYFVEIEQLSLTRSAHEFWSFVEQQQNQGSLFDQPSGTVRSNLYSVDNPDELVLGYFGASSIKKTSAFITRENFPINTSPTLTINDDCRKINNSSNVRPPFW